MNTSVSSATTTIVEPDTGIAEALSTAVPGAGVHRSIAELDAHLPAAGPAPTVILGPSVELAQAAAFADHHRIQRPALGVILIRHEVDQPVLVEALRSGMREVLDTGDLTALETVVRRSQEVGRALVEATPGPTHEPDATGGSLVTVFSTKGGVGKSTVATNLATAFADQGQRTCLVDLDVQGGDVALMLQLTPGHSLADLSQISGEMDESGIRTLLTEHSANLQVLAAPVHLDANVPPVATSELLALLKTMFDVVVVDTSGSFDDYALNALDHSDTIVLVGTLDMPSLKALKLATSTLELLNHQKHMWRLVVNRADTKAGLSDKEFTDTLGLEASATIPASREVLSAVNRGEPVVRAHPGSAAGKAVTALAASLVTTRAPGGFDAVDVSGEPSRRSGRRSRRMKKVG